MTDRRSGETSATLGKYRILGSLGRGSMGVVYKAEDPEIGRVVAIKTLRKIGRSKAANMESALERFRTEARSAGKLRHPNIITVFDASIDGDTPFIVMDYVDGSSLDSLLHREGRLEPQRVIRLLKQLADALDEAHRMGVIHRDIKPSNLVVDSQDRLYVLDFGVARLNETIQEAEESEQPSEEAPKQEPVMGTPAYMSPEQILNKNLDHRSDLFSFALVAFELFTGSRPFPGETFKEVVNGILHSSPRTISSIVPSLPLQLEVEFEHALAKKPEDRFDTAAETVRVLENAVSGGDNLPAVPGGSGGKRGSDGSSRRGSEWKSIGSVPQEGQQDQKPSGAQDGSFMANRELIDPRKESGWGASSQQQSSAHYTPGEVFSHDDRTVEQQVRFRRKFSFLRVAILLLGIVSISSASFLLFSAVTGTHPRVLLGLEVKDELPVEELEAKVKENILGEKITYQPEDYSGEAPSTDGEPSELTDQQLYALLQSPDTPVKKLLDGLKVMRQRKLPGLIEAVQGLLDHESYIVRIESAQALAASQDRRAAQVLLKYLDDYDPLVRIAVAKAIGELGSMKSVGYLKRRYLVEENKNVRRQIEESVELITGLPFKG